MGFDEDPQDSNGDNNKPKSKTFFGLELSDGVVYTIVIILTLIFIRQVAVVIRALN